MGSIQRNFSGSRIRETISHSKQTFARAMAYQRGMLMMFLGQLISSPSSSVATMPSGQSGKRAALKGSGDRRPPPARLRKKK